MELEIPKEFYDSIKTVVRYQNKLLLIIRKNILS